MNKACFLPLVLAGAVASATFADTYTDQYTNVFTGVTAVSPAGVPSATGGSWATNGVVLTNAGDKVEFDAEGEAVLKLTVNAAPQDTNTIFRVAVNGTIEDVGELTTPASETQTAFAICTNSFHAWNGSAWVVLDEVPAGFDGSVPTNLLVEICYQGTNSARKARFTIGDTVLAVRTNSDQWVVLATQADNLSGFGVNGSGTLAAVNGEVMLGVAEYDGVKYGTLTKAVEVAEADTSRPVAVLRPTDEDITLGSDVKIADGGNVNGTIKVPEGKSVAVDVLPTKEEFTGQTLAGKSGEYTIPVKINGGTVNVVLPPEMSNKEIVGGVGHVGTTVTVTIRTAADVITNAAPGGKALAASEVKLREFLDANVKEAYEAADATSSTIAAAISTNGVNNIPLYQSYALGIDPGDSVKPVAVANDSAADGITLTIPAIDTAKYSGDYAIKYQVGAGTAQNDPGAIKVPLSTGSYPVKIVFE